MNSIAKAGSPKRAKNHTHIFLQRVYYILLEEGEKILLRSFPQWVHIYICKLMWTVLIADNCIFIQFIRYQYETNIKWHHSTMSFCCSFLSIVDRSSMCKCMLWLWRENRCLENQDKIANSMHAMWFLVFVRSLSFTDYYDLCLVNWLLHFSDLVWGLNNLHVYTILLYPLIHCIQLDHFLSEWIFTTLFY